METAKVDIEKLQLLNDRINQTIEALNQVRMSVHGLQAGVRSAGQFPAAQWANYGLSHSGMGTQIPGLATPWATHAQSPWFAQAYPQSGFGLSHSGIDPYRQAAVDPFVYARLVQTFPFLTEAPVMRQFY